MMPRAAIVARPQTNCNWVSAKKQTGTFIQTDFGGSPWAAASSGQTWRNEMAGFFTFDRNRSAIATEFKQKPLFGNAFSEFFS
jgi:hypothetical protein